MLEVWKAVVDRVIEAVVFALEVELAMGTDIEELCTAWR